MRESYQSRGGGRKCEFSCLEIALCGGNSQPPTLQEGNESTSTTQLAGLVDSVTNCRTLADRVGTQLWLKGVLGKQKQKMGGATETQGKSMNRERAMISRIIPNAAIARNDSTRSIVYVGRVLSIHLSPPIPPHTAEVLSHIVYRS